MGKQAVREGEARYTMRLPLSLYEALKTLAKEQRRSVNQQMVQLIADAVEGKEDV